MGKTLSPIRTWYTEPPLPNPSCSIVPSHVFLERHPKQSRLGHREALPDELRPVANSGYAAAEGSWALQLRRWNDVGTHPPPRHQGQGRQGVI